MSDVTRALARAILHDAIKPIHHSADEWERAGVIVRNSALDSAAAIRIFLRDEGFDVVSLAIRPTPTVAEEESDAPR